MGHKHIPTNIRNSIVEELAKGTKRSEIVEKYGVSPNYVSKVSATCPTRELERNQRWTTKDIELWNVIHSNAKLIKEGMAKIVTVHGQKYTKIVGYNQ